MVIKVNCIYLHEDGFRCLHKDKPRTFFWMQPICMDNFKKCKLKVEKSRPSVPPPSPQSNVMKGNKNELHHR